MSKEEEDGYARGDTAGQPGQYPASQGPGLLDDLPEQGRGAEPASAGTAASPADPVGAWPNPFNASSHQPAGQADAEHADASAAAPPAAGPRSDPSSPPQSGARALEPNVIPFRHAAQERPPVAEPLPEAPLPAAPPEPPLRSAPSAVPSAAPAGLGTHAPSAVPSAAPAGSDPNAYSDADRDAIYRAIAQRRDVRTGFRADAVPDEVLTRVLQAAHQAPSVGFSQPWDFLVISDTERRSRIQELVRVQRTEYTESLPGARARAFSGLRIEAILDTPVNIAVTVDPTRGGRHTLGRHSQPQTAAYSTALAVSNLWLAARGEGLGVGWVSFFEERHLAEELGLPSHLEVVAYLCVGYVDEFPPEPELALSGWAKRRPLSWAVHHDSYGQRGLPGEPPTSLLEETVAAVGPLNQQAREEAKERQSRMTTPPGALGILEDLAGQMAGLAGQCPAPLPEPAAVAIFAGDHGVHAQGVTPWPQEVTAQMVENFLAGGAVANVFAQQVGAEVSVIDVGVRAELPTVPGLLPRKVARGTADFTCGPAMTRTQVAYAVEAGIEVARDLVAAGNRCLITGDMGIANTTASAALISAFTGRDPAEVTGRGTGVDDATHQHKIDVVRRALQVNRLEPRDPIGVLAGVGGLEHAAIAGFILGGAALRVPVLLDGVIAGSASLAAVALAPEAIGACVAGHRSSEPGHAAALEHLGLRPLVDLELRLGEGSGALLALPLLQSAVRALRDVATFDSAGVAQRE